MSDIPFSSPPTATVPLAAAEFSSRGTRAEVSIHALQRNLGAVRSRSDDCEVCAIVKANGYGLGGGLVAGALQSAGVKRFGVATVEEGLALRAGGIEGTILVLGGAAWARTPSVLTNARLTPVISSVEEALLLHDHVERDGVDEPYPVHVAIDTGMGREGFVGLETSSCIDEIISTFGQTPHLDPQGAMTHFANADLSDSELTGLQIERFARAVEGLLDANLPLRCAHIANSAAILSYGGRPGRLADAAFDHLEWWVRPGLMLTGVTPFADGHKQEALTHALHWKAGVVVKKAVPAGMPISYGSTFVTGRPSTIAVLGIGYADGFHRQVSGRGASVLIGGARAPLLGRVCMDLCVVDLTDLPPSVRDAIVPGDEVTVLGGDSSHTIEPWLVAEQAGTIAYEVLTSIAARVPRVPVR